MQKYVGDRVYVDEQGSKNTRRRLLLLIEDVIGKRGKGDEIHIN